MTGSEGEHGFPLRAALEAERARRDDLAATLLRVRNEISRLDQELRQIEERRAATLARLDLARASPPPGPATGANYESWLDYIRGLADLEQRIAAEAREARARLDRTRTAGSVVTGELGECEGKVSALEKLRQKHGEETQQRRLRAEDSERDDISLSRWSRRQGPPERE